MRPPPTERTSAAWTRKHWILRVSSEGMDISVLLWLKPSWFYCLFFPQGLGVSHNVAGIYFFLGGWGLCSLKALSTVSVAPCLWSTCEVNDDPGNVLDHHLQPAWLWLGPMVLKSKTQLSLCCLLWPVACNTKNGGPQTQWAQSGSLLVRMRVVELQVWWGGDVWLCALRSAWAISLQTGKQKYLSVRFRHLLASVLKLEVLAAPLMEGRPSFITSFH